MEINKLSFMFQFFIPLILFISMAFTWQRDRKSSRLPLPPCPKPWPIVGCLPRILRKKPAFRWIHDVMNKLDTEIPCIRLGNVHVIPVTCPKISCQFLKEKDSAFVTRPLIMSAQIASSVYLTTATAPLGEQWQKMKGLLVSEMLSPAKQKLFNSKRLEEANHLVRYVNNECSKSEDFCASVNIQFVLQHYCAKFD